MSVERLNESCFCITLDREHLHAAMERATDDPEFTARHIRPREHLFSNVPVFHTVRDLERMTDVVRMIETAARLPTYQGAVLARSPEIARFDPGPRGVFMGYDFHLADGGPKLIEVNTNAGGAFLNALLARAQHACCSEVDRALGLPMLADFDRALIAMFQSEWRSQRGTDSLRRIAIVDDRPQDQYLYPEFLLARAAFRRHGFEAVIADASSLHYGAGKLWAGATSIDLVYNRLVDFPLARLEHADLRAAYLDGAVVVTPNPRHHALLADKRNLIILSNPLRLESLGVDPALAANAVQIPKTVHVSADNADQLWADRKAYFFKPAAGHGAKAVYRGDKVTRGVWQQIVEGAYVAQAFAPPGERVVELASGRAPRKADVRLYTYGGTVMIAAARLYQGQATNFRTPGGGFAPVFFVPPLAAAESCQSDEACAAA